MGPRSFSSLCTVSLVERHTSWRRKLQDSFLPLSAGCAVRDAPPPPFRSPGPEDRRKFGRPAGRDPDREVIPCSLDCLHHGPPGEHLGLGRPPISSGEVARPERRLQDGVSVQIHRFPGTNKHLPVQTGRCSEFFVGSYKVFTDIASRSSSCLVD
jgi:hypothetical protein